MSEEVRTEHDVQAPEKEEKVENTAPNGIEPETGTDVQADADTESPVEEAGQPDVETPSPAEEAVQPEAGSESPAEEAVQADADSAQPEETPTNGGTDTETVEPEKPKQAPSYRSKAEVIARLETVVEKGEDIERGELENLKQAYYKLRNAEVAAAREAFLADGGAEETFTPPADTDEERFKSLMTTVKERRAQLLAEQEREKQSNMERKLAIIERIKEMAATPDSADKAYNEFKQLQAEWKELKNVPSEQASELWKNYQHNVEQFYDQLRLNHEFRAYDFKKNLEIKTRLCEAAEKLADVDDVVSAFHQLQKLHQEFRETGPVAKELREEIWARFKAASTVVNKRHQAHFERLKAQEEENLVKKTQLCEQVEQLIAGKLQTASDWDKTTKQILELQTQWRGIGFTPKKENARIFERFRTACDQFFHAKSEHFKHLRETYSANLAAKTALCEKAEAMKDNTDWQATTSRFIQLQKDWKAIGPVSHKASVVVWKRFSEACNYFFEKKAAATSSQREEEMANLEQKRTVIDKLKAMLDAPDSASREEVRALMDEWGTIGHVPFRQKDKIYKEYREIVDKLFDLLHMNAGRRQVEKFRRNVGDKEGDALTHERNRLFSSYEAKKAEIQTYENNLTFLNAKSKSGNSLVDGINKKIERLKNELEVLRQKIEAVDSQMEAEDSKEA